MPDLESLVYPRYLHGPKFAHLLVQTPDEAQKALTEGWSVLVVFDEPQDVVEQVFGRVLPEALEQRDPPFKRGPGRPKKTP